MTKEYCTCLRLTKGLFSNKYLTVSFFEKLNPKRLKGDEKLPLFIKCHISITVWFKGKVLQKIDVDSYSSNKWLHLAY